MKMYRLKYTHNCTYSYCLLIFRDDLRVACMLDRSLSEGACTVYNAGQAWCTRCSYQEEKRAKPGNLPKTSTVWEMWEHWIEKYFHIVSKGLMNSDVCGKKLVGSGDGLISRTITEFFQLPNFSQDIFYRGWEWNTSPPEYNIEPKIP
jgi:hypothetical protein